MEEVWDPARRVVVNICDIVPDVSRPIAVAEAEAEATYVCPLCGGQAWPVATSRKRTPHFSHRRRGVCLADDLDFDPFDRLRDVQADPASAAAMRALFKQNWETHYRRLDGFYGGIVPFLKVDEFLHMAIRAADRGVFGLRDIVESDIPQLLALMIEFPPENGRRSSKGSIQRTYWFRFWWLAPVAVRGEPWNFPELQNEFVRGSFSPPVGTRPRPDDLVKLVHRPDIGRPDVQKPVRTEAPIADFVKKRVNAWFATHPSFR